MSSLPISLIREFHSKNLKEKHTSKVMVICVVVVHQGECPPGDQGVGCKHGTHACLCLISAIHRQMEVSFIDNGCAGGGWESRDNREDSDANGHPVARERTFILSFELNWMRTNSCQVLYAENRA